MYVYICICMYHSIPLTLLTCKNRLHKPGNSVYTSLNNTYAACSHACL